MPSCRDRDAAMRWPRCAARAARQKMPASVSVLYIIFFWCVKHSSCVCHNEHRFARSSPLVVYSNKETNNILNYFLIHNPRSHAPHHRKICRQTARDRQISSHFFRSEDHTNLLIHSNNEHRRLQRYVRQASLSAFHIRKLANFLRNRLDVSRPEAYLVMDELSIGIELQRCNWHLSSIAN